MQDAKAGSHTIWDCKYHIVWITKYRFPVLGGDVGQRGRELLREIARAHEPLAEFPEREDFLFFHIGAAFQAGAGLTLATRMI